ncbi:MAG: hypothetical protein ACRD1X_03690, partial [Vicinamibacteria bacterium]
MGDTKVDEGLSAFVIATPNFSPLTEDKVIVRLDVPGRAELSLRRGLWTVAAMAQGYWGGPQEVLAGHGQDSTELRLSLWRAGRLRGSIPTGAEPELPREIGVKFSRTLTQGSSQEMPSGEVLCPIEAGVWSCGIPVGEFDLRLVSRGFIPQYIWGAKVSADRTLDLGSIPLRRGASVVGWVQTHEGLPDPESCTVELRTVDASPVVLRAENGSREKLFEASVNDRGFFQIKDPPPGRFLLVAKQPGFADASVSLQVLEDREAELAQPLLLTPAERLEVFIQPPTDPSGTLWQVTVLSLGSQSNV